MQDIRLPCIRLQKLHVIVCTHPDIFDVLHVVVDPFYDMVTGRAECHELLPLFLRLVQCTDGGELCRNLITAKRIDTSAALPVLKLLQFKSKYHR